MTSDVNLRQARDADGAVINRAMAIPSLIQDVYLGKANQWVDLVEMSPADRIFVGISVINQGATDVYLAIGDDTANVANIRCIPNGLLVLDEQSFGPGCYDEVLGFNATKIRGMIKSNSGVLATGVLTYTGQPANGEIVEINGVDYQFETVLGDLTNGNTPVLIGADADASFANLVVAVTDQAVTLVQDTMAGTVTVTSNYGGATGNAITTTTTIPVNASWGAAALSGGTIGIAPIIHIW